MPLSLIICHQIWATCLGGGSIYNQLSRPTHLSDNRNFSQEPPGAFIIAALMRRWAMGDDSGLGLRSATLHTAVASALGAFPHTFTHTNTKTGSFKTPDHNQDPQVHLKVT